MFLKVSAEVAGHQNPSVKPQNPAQDLCLSPRQMNTLKPSFPTLVYFLDSGSLEAPVLVCKSVFVCARAFKSRISNTFAYLRLKGWRRKDNVFFFFFF